MTTQVFMLTGASDIHLGTNSTKLNGSAVGWQPLNLLTARGSGVASTDNVLTVTGPTNGIEVVATQPIEWISLPLDQDVTISGTITFNLWAFESNMSANVAINAVVERIDGATGQVASQIIKTARTTEVAVTTSAVNNFTGTPTSTNMLKGDRIRIRVFGDDSTANMATGFTFTFRYNGTTAAADGDSFITFNETFGFQTTEPTGTVLYLRATVSDVTGANEERALAEVRGSSSTTAVTDTQAGWAAPKQITLTTTGDVPIEWYSRRLNGFTLSGLVRLNVQMFESIDTANTALTVELATVESDGSGAVVWSSVSPISKDAPGGAPNIGTAHGELPTSSAIPIKAWLSGPDTVVTAGKRLRLKLYLNDMASLPSGASQTVTMLFDGPTPDAAGDAWIQLPQLVSTYARAKRAFRSRSNYNNLSYY